MARPRTGSLGPMNRSWIDLAAVSLWALAGLGASALANHLGFAVWGLTMAAAQAYSPRLDRHIGSSALSGWAVAAMASAGFALLLVGLGPDVDRGGRALFDPWWSSRAAQPWWWLAAAVVLATLAARSARRVFGPRADGSDSGDGRPSQ